MTYESEYALGDLVYLATDPDQYERIVTGITIRQSGIVYSLSQGTVESCHYSFEMTKYKDELKNITQ